MSDKWCTECEHLGTGEGLCTSCVDDKNFEPKGDRRTRMTREVAIKAIQDFIGWFKEDSLIRKALDMAIKALSQEPSDDAISRKDAEQMFRNIRSHLKPQDYKSAEEFNTRDLMLLNAEQMIHALPSVTQKSGKWIPVSERLPEDGKWAIFTDGKNISVERFKLDAISHFFPNGRWFELKDAIAWMPLPKPYEPQESEDKE